MHSDRSEPGWIARRWPFLVAGLLIASGFAGLDEAVYAWCRRYTMPDPTRIELHRQMAWIWDVVRFPASAAGGLGVFFLALLMQPWRWPRFTLALIACVSADLTGFVLKLVVGRVRPNRAAHGSHLEFLPPFGGFREDSAVAFPSGEATAAFALATVLALLWPRWRRLFYGVAVVSSVSRLLKGAHYLSDVAAGALLGTLLAGLVFNRLRDRFDRLHPVAAVPS